MAHLCLRGFDSLLRGRNLNNQVSLLKPEFKSLRKLEHVPLRKDTTAQAKEQEAFLLRHS